MATADYKLKYQITADASKAKAEVKGLDALFGKIGKGGKGGGIGSVFGGNLASQAVTNLTGQLLDGGKAVFDYSSKLEQSKIGFETLMGGAEAASKHIKELQNLSTSTPLDFPSLAKISQRLQGAGIEAQNVTGLIKDIGNVAAATGELSAERLEGIGVAISQVFSKGKVSAEEMEQLAERGIPAWRILSQTLGMTVAETRKLAEDGKITAKVMIDAFQKFSQQHYGDAMEKQAQTFSGAWAKITNVVMASSSEMFAPVYAEISTFTTKIADSLDSQKAKAKAKDAGVSFGFALGEAIGDGMERSKVGDTGWWLSVMYPLARISHEIHQFAAEIGKGIRQGSLDNSQADPGDEPLNLLAHRLKQINADVKKVPSLANKLESDKAKKETESLNKLIGDLAGRITFFGDETEVAATKQKLLNDGVIDFNSALAKNAVSLARQLDGLKAEQKARDEYNDGLKSTREELRRMEKDALFDIRFPEATELQKFDAWVTDQAGNFRELHGEIQRTREALQSAAVVSGLRKSHVGVAGALDALSQQTTGLSGEAKGEVEQYATDFANALKAIGAGIGPDLFGKEVSGFVNAYLTLEETLGTGETEEEAKAIADSLGKVRKALRDYLWEFKFVASNMAHLNVLGSRPHEVEAATDGFIKLGRAVGDSTLQQGIKELDGRLDQLGLHFGNDGLVKDAADFQKFISDPKVTAAIEARAMAMGRNADEVKRLAAEMRKALEGGLPTSGPFYIDPKARQDTYGGGSEERDRANRFKEGLFGNDGLAVIESEAEFIKNVYLEMQGIVGGVIDSLAQGVDTMVEAWVLYGTAGPDALRKMTAQVLASAAAEAAVQAVLQAAYGLASLAFGDFAGAALHFQAAAAFGVIAATFALAGRAVAGDSFSKDKSGGASSSSDNSQSGARPRSEDLAPSSRQNADTFISGSKDRAIEVLSRAVSQLEQKIGSMRPGDVLTRGIQQKPGVVGNAVVKDIGRNASLGTAVRRKSGLR